ncbi:enoyl-CoA hydratase [Caulobacter sp. D4A]|uniref:enoyl-CoA hydratase-related protein n=1 Tax=unclassified Caulobacter TaxID=2648921 RepID=UPI000D73B1BC|nr:MULTISPECIES: enoyl-CoA hydratase-related protein [unclassified Caulobacter]PXA71359.1 enoyl-CoA hydratase [Caulobacter sp. D4A]PXA87696.1 enoyl-CoA hydratase [Caulobacter sp. D5]
MTNPIADPIVEVPDTDAMSPLVHIDSTPEGAVTVWINRPEKKNAFDSATIAALAQAFETLHGAEGVRVVFLRGVGGTFCAGADLEWMASAADWSEDDNRADALDLAHMLKALHDIPALTVALVEGAAFGGGAGLVAACDHALATADAKFAFSEVKLGLTPATISPYVIAALGPRTAKLLFATGRVFDADAAWSYGLVDEVFDDVEGLVAAQDALIEEVIPCAPGAIGDAKALVNDFAFEKIDRGLIDDSARRIARRRVSDEGQEGVRAFLAKRKPNWAAES